jgi:hypothetical protein
MIFAVRSPSKMLFRVLVAILGILAVVIVSKPFRNHSVTVISHLQSGNWEAISDTPYLEGIVRANYNDTTRWAIKFVGASGQSYPLSEGARAATIKFLGTSSFGENVILAPIGVLPQSYSKLVQDLVVLGIDEKWLIDAKSALRIAAISQSDRFPSFLVPTRPSFDRPGAWDSASVSQNPSLEQFGRCRGKVGYGAVSAASTIGANMSIRPRLVEVIFNRSWLSEVVLDQALAMRVPKFREYFGPEGSLRLVPHSLWILLPEAVAMTFTSDTDAETIRKQISDNNCCRISCNGMDWSLVPGIFDITPSGEVIGRRSDAEPYLYAVVARRRAIN